MPRVKKSSIITQELLDQFDGDVKAVVSHQKAKALEYAKENGGSIPEDWDPLFGIRESLGRPPKYATAESFVEKGVAYFEMARDRRLTDQDYLPTLEGFSFWMGFGNHSQLQSWVRRHPEFAFPHSRFLSLLRMPIEDYLNRMGVNTKGLMYRIGNIPEGWEPEEAATAPVRYGWKERRTTEVTGADGAPIMVSTSNKTPEEVYAEMMQRGARLAPPVEVSEGKEGE